MIATPVEIFEFDGREVRLFNLDRVYLPRAGIGKGDPAHFWLAAADAVLNRLRALARTQALHGRDGGQAL